MLLVEYFNSQISVMQNLDFIARIIVSCLCGMCIGYERSRRLKEVGIRTHIIVCSAAALIMIVSKYGFLDLVDPSGNFLNGTRGADPARIAAQVVSGVSFLGAGTIFRHRNVVKGLTTAAGIWATAGIGLAIGAGLYWIGLFSTILLASIQVVTHKYAIGVDAYTNNFLDFLVDDTTQFQQTLEEFVSLMDAQILDYSISKESKKVTKYSVTLKTLQPITLEQLNRFISKHDEIQSASTSSYIK
jgi:putative Mg2+ transporter-C (MgtC) family protein